MCSRHTPDVGHPVCQALYSTATLHAILPAPQARRCSVVRATVQSQAGDLADPWQQPAGRTNRVAVRPICYRATGTCPAVAPHAAARVVLLLLLAFKGASAVAGAGCTYPGKHSNSVSLPVLCHPLNVFPVVSPAKRKLSWCGCMVLWRSSSCTNSSRPCLALTCQTRPCTTGHTRHEV
jgi:hypothetical protein